MSSEIESIYDQYVQNLQRALPKVDANLSHRIMYLERKLASEYVKEPHVILFAECKSGTDMEKKLYDLREKFSLEAENSEEANTVLAMGRMKLDKLIEISADEDIVKLSGKASPIIRS
jgi:DNA replicative helicase MCM subunit Mcm2 (Cdc46/Mcm family)